MMDAKFPIVVLLFWTCTFLTAPVHVLGGKKIKPRLDKLENKITTSTTEISALQQTARSMEQRLTALESDCTNTDEESVTRLEEMINDLKDSHGMAINNMNKRLDEIIRFQQTFDLASLQKQIETNTQNINGYDDSLNKAVDALTSKLDNKVIDTTKYIDTKVSAIQTSISSTTNILNKKIDEYKTDSVTIDDVLRLQQGKKISFSARTKASVDNIEPESTLVLTDVINNEGNGYSSTTGKFTAPIDGIYVFFVHILGSSRILEMRMDKNDDQRVLYVYADGRNRGDGSNMVVLEMVKGDTVNVVKHGPWGTRPFFVYRAWTSFSGFLLYEK